MQATRGDKDNNANFKNETSRLLRYFMVSTLHKS